MCLAQGPQPSDAGEARTRGLSVSSQTLNHWATALPKTGWNPSIISSDSMRKHNFDLENVCLFGLFLYVPVNNCSVMSGLVFLGWSMKYKARINVSCSRTQRSDAGEAWTHNPSVMSQALYHWATPLHSLTLKIRSRSPKSNNSFPSPNNVSI